MRDALGGTVVLVIIVVFIVIVSGYMAFNVNYTKAFRIKNKVVDSFNKYGDSCTTQGSKCDDEISEYAKSIGYNPIGLTCDGRKLNDSDLHNLNTSGSRLYCYTEHLKEGSTDSDIVKDGTYHYYTIVTKIDINIPIIENSLGLRFLTIKGDTKTFKKG